MTRNGVHLMPREEHSFLAAIEYTEALIAQRPVTVRRRVAWGDCDPAAVVYTPRFCDYVVSARDWFMRAGLGILDRPHPARPAITYPMRAMSFDFGSRLKADDHFDMLIRVDNITRRTFTVAVEATHVDGASAGSGRVFTALLTSVCVDPGTGLASNLPDQLRASLERYRDEISAI